MQEHDVKLKYLHGAAVMLAIYDIKDRLTIMTV